MTIEKNIKNGMIAAGRLRKSRKNTPPQYKDRQKQYLEDPTSAFAHQYAKYAGNFIEARVQGLDPGDPDSWETAYIRMADIAPDTASTLRKQDDYKIIMFADESIEYLPEGAKIECMGSTWLAVNPSNISNAIGGGVVQRCRSVWNHLDWYGNLLSEPVCVEKAILTANESDMQEYALITKGYVNITCQRNAHTRQLNTNSRIILGSGAYRITGFGDWAQEFTGNYDSVRLLEFTARYEPPNLETDDMQRHVAGGKTFSWEIRISGNPVIGVGQASRLDAVSTRCGKRADADFDHPVSYLWESSDTEIADVGMDGSLIGMAEGTCKIKCTLEQNPEISQVMEITVVAAEEKNEVAFLGTVPARIRAYESVTLEAAYFENGEQRLDRMIYTCSGPDAEDYSVSQSENRLAVTCWSASRTPLTVRAAFGEYQAEVKIGLEGL